jgi:hypothetical protein
MIRTILCGLAVFLGVLVSPVAHAETCRAILLRIGNDEQHIWVSMLGGRVHTYLELAAPVKGPDSLPQQPTSVALGYHMEMNMPGGNPAFFFAPFMGPRGGGTAVVSLSPDGKAITGIGSNKVSTPQPVACS